MNNENINKFIEYESKHLNEKRCVDRIICIWLFNVIFYFVGINSAYTGIFVSVMNLVITILLFKLMGNLDKIENRLLFNGTYNFYLSCMMALISYKVLNRANLYILLCCFLVFFVLVSVLWSVVFFVVNSGKYKYRNKETKNSLYPYAGALFGYLLAKFIFENLELSQENSQIFISIILLILAIGLNSTNLDLMKLVLKKRMQINNVEDSSKR